MSITNYGELKTAIGNWIHRTDLTSRIPEFISMAESRIANEVRVRNQHTRSTATASTQYVAMPSDFLEIKDIHINSDPVQPLTYLSPKALSEKFPSSTTGKPRFYTIQGDEFELKPIPSTDYTLEISYIKRYAAFSADADTNWLLTNYPNIYLYASLIESAPFLYDNEGLSTYTQLYKDAVNQLAMSENKAKYGNVLAAKLNTATP